MKFLGAAKRRLVSAPANPFASRTWGNMEHAFARHWPLSSQVLWSPCKDRRSQGKRRSDAERVLAQGYPLTHTTPSGMCVGGGGGAEPQCSGIR